MLNMCCVEKINDLSFFLSFFLPKLNSKFKKFYGTAIENWRR